MRPSSPRRKWIDLLPKGMGYMPCHGPAIDDEHLPKGEIYVACEDYDFTWSREDIRKVIRWWNAGMPIRTMAHVLQRDPDEIAVLIMGLVREDRLAPRTGGIWGKSI